MNIIDVIEKENENPNAPIINIGDTVKVFSKIKEGEKERLQAYEGVVIAKKNGSVRETFTVRRLSYGEGVERVFPVNSPNIAKIEVDRESVPMRAKLYYIRDRIGKEASKVKEKRLANY